MKNRQNSTGQALISLLVFSVIGIAVSYVTTVITLNSRMQTVYAGESIRARSGAITGVELALLGIIRNPSYVGQTINIDDTEITITVTGSQEKDILIHSKAGLSIYKVSSKVEFKDNRLVVLYKKPVY
jgi:hypothetical protein